MTYRTRHSRKRRLRQQQAAEAVASWTPSRERRAIIQAINHTPPAQRAAAVAMAQAIRLAQQQTAAARARDQETDAQRRKLIGARVPIQTARRIEAAAAGEGISVYRWIVNAYEDALRVSAERLRRRSSDPPMESPDVPPWE